jgi:hypothetical protein
MALLSGCSHPADTPTAAPPSAGATGQIAVNETPHMTKAALDQEIQQIQNNPNLSAGIKAQTIKSLQQQEATAP